MGLIVGIAIALGSIAFLWWAGNDFAKNAKGLTYTWSVYPHTHKHTHKGM